MTPTVPRCLHLAQPGASWQDLPQITLTEFESAGRASWRNFMDLFGPMFLGGSFFWGGGIQHVHKFAGNISDVPVCSSFLNFLLLLLDFLLMHQPFGCQGSHKIGTILNGTSLDLGSMILSPSYTTSLEIRQNLESKCYYWLFENCFLGSCNGWVIDPSVQRNLCEKDRGDSVWLQSTNIWPSRWIMNLDAVPSLSNLHL